MRIRLRCLRRGVGWGVGGGGGRRARGLGGRGGRGRGRRGCSRFEEVGRDGGERGGWICISCGVKQKRQGTEYVGAVIYIYIPQIYITEKRQSR